MESASKGRRRTSPLAARAPALLPQRGRGEARTVAPASSRLRDGAVDATPSTTMTSGGAEEDEDASSRALSTARRTFASSFRAGTTTDTVRGGIANAPAPDPAAGSPGSSGRNRTIRLDRSALASATPVARRRRALGLVDDELSARAVGRRGVSAADRLAWSSRADA